MVVLQQGNNTLTFSPNRDLPWGTTGRLYLTLKSRATSQAKSFYTDTDGYTDAPRAVTMVVRVNEQQENLATGYIDLDAPDYPTGYYSYILYQANSDQQSHTVIDVGVAYYVKNSGEGFVTYFARSGAKPFKTYEK